MMVHVMTMMFFILLENLLQKKVLRTGHYLRRGSTVEKPLSLDQRLMDKEKD